MPLKPTYCTFKRSIKQLRLDTISSFQMTVMREKVYFLFLDANIQSHGGLLTQLNSHMPLQTIFLRLHSSREVFNPPIPWSSKWLASLISSSELSIKYELWTMNSIRDWLSGLCFGVLHSSYPSAWVDPQSWPAFRVFLQCRPAWHSEFREQRRPPAARRRRWCTGGCGSGRRGTQRRDPRLLGNDPAHQPWADAAVLLRGSDLGVGSGSAHGQAGWTKKKEESKVKATELKAK